MDLTLFLVSLALACTGPLLAIGYLRAILAQTLRSACEHGASPEFWIRCATLMAVSGTLLLTVGFGQFDDHATLLDAVRRALWLTLLGVFSTVTVIWLNVSSQVQAAIARTRLPAPPAPSTREGRSALASPAAAATPGAPS